MSEKIQPQHLARKAMLYVRQSSAFQVINNQESSKLQYAMQARLHALGFSEIEVIDEDLGRSAAGTVCRSGFERMVAEVSLGRVGATPWPSTSEPSMVELRWNGTPVSISSIRHAHRPSGFVERARERYPALSSAASAARGPPHRRLRVQQEASGRSWPQPAGHPAEKPARNPPFRYNRH